MGILLPLLGVLAAASGALKLRARVRALTGTSVLAVFEAVACAVLVLASGAGLGRARPVAWAAVGVVAGLTIAATVVHVRAASAGSGLLPRPSCNGMLATWAVIHAQPLWPFPSKGPREAKGGRLPDRHRRSLCVATERRRWGVGHCGRPKDGNDACE